MINGKYTKDFLKAFDEAYSSDFDTFMLFCSDYEIVTDEALKILDIIYGDNRDVNH